MDDTWPTLPEELRKRSPLRFETFMELALYHPRHGFYSRPTTRLGAGGHFTTAPEVHSVLAEAIVTLFAGSSQPSASAFPGLLGELFASYSQRDWAVIEVGAGSGAYAAGLLAACRADGVALAGLHLVERSPTHRAALAERFRGEPLVRLHDSTASAVAAAGSRALVFSNELPDAFPARQLCFWEGQWQEVWLDWSGGAVAEVFRPLGEGMDCDAPARPREGQRLFVHPAYHRWLREELAGLREGAVITVDYGAARPSGECRAYENQQRFDGFAVYERPGERDLTCDVNFADLQRWGEQLGWETFFRADLASFLNTVHPRADAVCGEAERRLRSPFDAGGAFQVLVQAVRPRP